MTNEKIIEEIWHLVYEYKINEKVESTPSYPWLTELLRVMSKKQENNY